MTQSNGSFLPGVRVLELADELGEYCGKLLAGLGADVVKIEPPGGEKTRSYGPFYGDEPHPNRSIYFWHYNFGKRGIVLDLDSDDDRQHFVRTRARRGHRHRHPVDRSTSPTATSATNASRGEPRVDLPPHKPVR